MLGPSLLIASLASAAFLLGCGGSVQQTTSGTTGAGGAATLASATGTTGAMATTGATTTTATGMGGGAVASSSTASGGGAGGQGGAGTGGQGTGGQGTGGGRGCSGKIDVVVDNGGPQHWTSICAGSWGAMHGASTPVGFQQNGGVAQAPSRLFIVGCAGPAQHSEGIQLVAPAAVGPGTYTMGTTTYTDPAGKDWGAPGDGFNLVVTRLDPVGGVVEGSFNVNVSHGGNAAHLLQGTFHVCRVGDQDVP